MSVYSDETMDSISQQLSRYVREIGERYLPSMKVNTVFMGDRLGRGGDHTPFQWEGFAAVRISTPNEIYANQHRATDLLANMSVPYTDEGGEGEPGGGGEPGAGAEAAHRDAGTARGRRTAGRRRCGSGGGAARRGRRTPSHADDRARRRLRRGAALARRGPGGRHQRLHRS